MTRKISSLLLLLALGLAACVLPWSSRVNDPRPNIILIISDDQRYDTMEYMPRTTSLIFEQGVSFSHGYITTPLCCPSRASILTGMYARKHQVHTNEDVLNTRTVVEYLHNSGYYTGLVGKYLNTWKGEPRPEFDYWVSYARGETRYTNPRLNVNGEWLRHQQSYTTDLFRDYAIEFMDTAVSRDKPFFLMLAFNAPHEPVTPAKEDRNALPDLPLHRPPSHNEADISDKPLWMVETPLLTQEEIQIIDDFRRNQILTLLSLDRAIDSVIADLDQKGLLDNTVVIYISDNGKQWGEHRLRTKNTVYEEAVRVPFAIRYPTIAPVPVVLENVVSNIDIAPTLCELANIPIPPDMDGLSLLPLIEGQSNWREGVLLEGWPGRGNYIGIHTQRFVYVETLDDREELYDLEFDPFEMINLVDDPNYRDILESMQRLLESETLAHPAP